MVKRDCRGFHGDRWYGKARSHFRSAIMEHAARPTTLSILVIDENRLRASVINSGLREAGHDNLTIIHDVIGIARRIAEIEPDVIVVSLENPNRDMLENMFPAGGAVDGYCVGEPWNTAAAVLGRGHIATVKAAIWRSSPEKVLSVAAKWAEDNPAVLAALLRALCRSAQWCTQAANREEPAQILAGNAYVARPAEWLLRGLSGELDTGGGESTGRRISLCPSRRPRPFPGRATPYKCVGAR